MDGWKSTAVVWLNDPVFRRVALGQYGFVWWEANGRNVIFAPFGYRSKKWTTAFHSFTDWDNVLSFDRTKIERRDVLRFVRTGLAPKNRG